MMIGGNKIMKKKVVRRIILFAILFALMIIVQVAAGVYIYNSLTQLVILLNSTSLSLNLSLFSIPNLTM